MKKYLVISLLVVMFGQVSNAQSTSEQYNAKLAKSCEEYNAKLAQDPFYDGSKVTYKAISSKVKKNALAKEYKAAEKKMAVQYNNLVNGIMAENLKTKDADKYIEAYVKVHPEKGAKVADLRIEFRCHDRASVNAVILAALENEPYTMTSCREVLYQKYADLFDSKAEFEQRFNEGAIIDENSEELKQRTEATQRLDSFEEYLKANPKLNLQEMSLVREGSPKYEVSRDLNYFKRTYFYGKALDLVFQYNEKTQKEYNKNGQYFANKENFFSAYISSMYKMTLKMNKQQKK